MNQNKSDVHILVVDDEPLLLYMLRRGIEYCNYKVSAANNGLEALHIMAEQDVDMVLTDIRMPVMDGLTAIKFLRKCEQGSHLSLTEHDELAQSLNSRVRGSRTPVVAITGSIDDREILIEAGMNEFITKPFNLKTVHNVLDKFCGESCSLSRRENRGH